MKNLKMFAIGLAAMAAMTMGVNALEVPSQCKNDKLYVDLGDSKYSCASSVANAISAAKNNKGGEIVLLQDIGMTLDNTIEVDTTINLNGHKLTITAAKAIKIKEANVTIKNGTIDATASTSSIFEVYSTNKASKLTFEDDVTIDGTNIDQGAVVKVKDATNKTEVNINGTWDLKNEIVDCDNGQDKDLTVNLNATVTGTGLTGALVSLDAGSTVVNVLGGSYESNKAVFALQNGTLNISDGKINSTGSHAIKVLAPTTKNNNELNITGGEISSTKNGDNAGYSLVFAGSSKTGTYKISKGTFTSAKDADGNQLPAISISDKSFLENHANMISGGTFIGGIVDDVLVGKEVYQTAEAAVKALVGDATVTNENGTVVVGTQTSEPTNPDQPTTDPSQTDTPSTGDPADNPSEPPKTGDNIMAFVGLGIASLAVVGLGTKNLKKQTN